MSIINKKIKKVKGEKNKTNKQKKTKARNKRSRQAFRGTKKEKFEQRTLPRSKMSGKHNTDMDHRVIWAILVLSAFIPFHLSKQPNHWPGNNLAQEPKSRKVRADKFLAEKFLTPGVDDKSYRRGKRSALHTKVTSMSLLGTSQPPSREKEKQALEKR